MTPEQAAAETGGSNASAMLEIGRVNLRFAAACRGPAPFGAILVSTPFSLSVNRRSAVHVCCCSVAAGGYWSVLAGSEAAYTCG